MEEIILEIKKIFKTYRSGDVQVPALKGVSLVINKGDFLIVTGRNGSGKSTLLRQIGLLDRPDTGDIFLGKQNVTKTSEKERLELRLKNLGYVFQDYALMPDLTALENVMLPSMMLKKTKICRKIANTLLNKIGLQKRKQNLPNQLSGGEQQKVAIARALVNNPDILVADEPTANLDSRAAKDVLEIFKKLNKEEKHTIIMVTHEKDEVSYGRRIIELSDGKIISDKNQK